MSEIKPQPSQQFLSMMIVQLRKCKQETGTSMIDFLSSFDAAGDDELRIKLHDLLEKLYPSN